jgi:hypothetical protein
MFGSGGIGDSADTHGLLCSSHFRWCIIANALKGDSQMAVEWAMRERGWPERVRNSAAIKPERTTGSRARVPESIDWKDVFCSEAHSRPDRSPDSALRWQPNRIGRKSRSGCAMDA